MFCACQGWAGTTAAVRLARRAPAAGWLSEKWQEEMRKIESCLHCNQCAAKCPYGLDTPRLLQDNYRDYWAHLER